MDLARPSNVGSLIGAVMVGLLALTANHYIQMDPQAIQKLFASGLSNDESTSENPEKFSLRFWELLRRDNSATPRPPEEVRQEILERMKSVETYLLESNEKQNSVGEQLPVGELDALVQLLDQLHARLEADEGASEEQRKEARLSRLYGRFLAAEMLPSSYSVRFLEIAAEGMSCPDETEASHAAALKLLHDLDPRNPSREKLLAEVQDFTQRFPGSDVGVYVYSIVSRKLWQQGHGALAEEVLQLGAKAYSGQSGGSRLLNQLFDQRRLRLGR